MGYYGQYHDFFTWGVPVSGSVPIFSVETLLVVRHFQVLIKKDIVRYEILSVFRHLQFLSKRHCPLCDIFSYQTFAVVWHLQLSDTCNCQTLANILFLLHFISQESLRPWILNISRICQSELQSECVLQKSFVGRIQVIYPKYSMHDAL